MICHLAFGVWMLSNDDIIPQVNIAIVAKLHKAHAGVNLQPRAVGDAVRQISAILFKSFTPQNGVCLPSHMASSRGLVLPRRDFLCALCR
jgi:hypothetical protein